MLQQAVLEYIGKRQLLNKPIPNVVKTCLASNKPLRPYQTECLQYFLSYMEDYEGRTRQPHLMFNMATGSGKTVIMAATILYLYEKGYRNFLFFVNSTNVIEKTRDNFFNTSSSKYLFAKNLSIGGKHVEVREVTSFQGVSNDCINICLKTLGKLHSELNTPRENGATYEDYARNKVVLIADEAHHLNSSTKRGKEKIVGELLDGEYKEYDDEDSRDWETTAQRIFLQNEENIMLEFTATIDEKDENIRNKYEDKIIYKYDLPRFCNDRYSKEVLAVKVDSDLQGRILCALVVSEYKRMLFASIGKNVKPVVLFKSKLKKDNAAAYGDFLRLLPNLDERYLQKIQSTAGDGIIKEAFDYLKDNGVTLSDLALHIREQFSEEHLLQVDGNTKMKKSDEMTADMQQLLNSLEESDNPIRAIFAVDMLNEGWDVLNLFDIVRLFDSRDANTKTKKSGCTTNKEAQLIGRGARYFAFVDKEHPELETDRRKYDNDVTNPLHNVETLHYYCPNEPRLISDLHNAFQEIGIPQNQEYVQLDLFLKDEFTRTDLYENGIVFYNKKLLKAEAEDDGKIGDVVKDKMYYVRVHTGATATSHVIEANKNDNTQIEIKNLSIPFIEVGAHVIRTAMDCYPAFHFCNLRKVFPSLLSISSFIESEHYLRDLSVIIQGRYGCIEGYSQHEKLFIARRVLEQIEPYVLKRRDEYVGSHEFIHKPFKKAFTKQRTMTFAKHVEGSGDERGVPMLKSVNNKYRIDLSQKEWYAYNDCYGTSEEKALVVYIDGISNKMRNKYENFYLVRNEKDVKTYDFEQGRCFEPDFILFMRRKNASARYDYMQIFLEPKGQGYTAKDQWKEDFLMQMHDQSNVRLCMETDEYRVWGVPFFTEQGNDGFRSVFEKDVLDDDADEPFRIVDTSDVPTSDRFTRFLPLYDVAIACGALVDEGVQSLGNNDVDMEGWIDVSDYPLKPNGQMFIVHAKGESMLPKIHPGDLCVFELYGGMGNAGSRDGKIVLARQQGKDNDYNCQYTIKEYHSVKDPQTGRNVKVELRPLNQDPQYKVIDVEEEDGEVRVIATLKSVLN